MMQTRFLRTRTALPVRCPTQAFTQGIKVALQKRHSSNVLINDRRPKGILSMSSFSPHQISEVPDTYHVFRLPILPFIFWISLQVLDLAHKVKQSPELYRDALAHKTLLMLFAKPSLRTRLSFEVGMTQLGGHAIYYPLDSNANMGGKESIYDTAQCVSKYCDAIMARVASRQTIQELAQHASVPVINALDDFGHPCQVLADLLTISELAPKTDGLLDLKLSFLGDLQNNVTYDLARGALLMGMRVSLAGPSGEGFDLPLEVLEECNQLAALHGGTNRRGCCGSCVTIFILLNFNLSSLLPQDH